MTNQRKTICVAGKNDIAVNVLSELITLRHQYDDFDIVVICNQNERGTDGWQRSLRKYAKQEKIPEVVLNDVYSYDELVFLSLEFDRIISPDKFLSKQLYNVHFSLLPAYKGMYTSALPILNDEDVTGVTFHRIARGIDTGEIIAQKAFPIENNDTARDLYLKYIKYGTELVESLLPQILENTCLSRPQPKEHSSYYSKESIDYENLVINLNETAYGISLQIRAFSFEEYQLPTVLGNTVCSFEILNTPSTHRPGELLSDTDRYIVISTIDYDLKLFKKR